MKSYNFICQFCGHEEAYWLSFCCVCKRERFSGKETTLSDTSSCSLEARTATFEPQGIVRHPEGSESASEGKFEESENR
jgi:hypothetical protein